MRLRPMISLLQITAGLAVFFMTTPTAFSQAPHAFRLQHQKGAVRPESRVSTRMNRATCYVTTRINTAENTTRRMPRVRTACSERRPPRNGSLVL